jgi:hypothetical protein
LSHLVGFEGPEECEAPRRIFQESFAIQLYRMPETGDGDSRLRSSFSTTVASSGSAAHATSIEDASDASVMRTVRNAV